MAATSTTNDLEAFESLDIPRLGELLACLREHGVTRAKIAGIEVDISLADLNDKLTWEELEALDEAAPKKPRRWSDTKFPGAK